MAGTTATTELRAALLSGSSRSRSGAAVEPGTGGRGSATPFRSGAGGSATGRSAKPARSAAAGRRRLGWRRGRTGTERGAGRDAPRRRALIPVAGGVVWAVLLTGTVASGTIPAAVLLVPVAMVATASAVRSVRRSGAPGSRAGRRGAGPTTARDQRRRPEDRRPGSHRTGSHRTGSHRTARLAVVALGPAVAACCLVLARHQGSDDAMALVWAVLAYDAGAFIMGHGRSATGGPVGVVSGLAGTAVVAVFVAAVMNPPFSGTRPWIVFGLVGALAPAGVWLCERACRRARLPALARIDSFVLSAPVWVVSLALLHR